MSANLDLVRALYAAFEAGDGPGILSLMSPDIIWTEAENFPLADRNPYVGPQAVLSGVFARLASDWEAFEAVPEELLDAGDTIVAIGRYRGTYRATGKTIEAQMVHVWRIADGKIVAFQQYTDTLQVARATGAA